MNPLSHTMPAWWPWLAAIWLVLVIALGLVFTRRADPHLSGRTRLLLWLTRSAASAILLLLILNWSAETTRQTDEKPAIRILTDRSASMAAKDAPEGASRFAYALHAAQSIAAVVPQASTTTFTSDLEAGVASNTPDGDRSAIGQALFRALDDSRQQALGGVVVLSDFAASDEDALKETLQIYHSAKVPVFPWIIGTEKQPADLRLISARLSQPSPSQPNLRLVATLESPGYAERDVALKIAYADQTLETKTIRLTGTRQTVTLDFASPYRGLHFYDIQLATLPGEATPANNSLRAACELRRDPIRVLYMEGSPPAETGYLKDALEADQDMEVHCLHLPPAGSPHLPGVYYSNAPLTPQQQAEEAAKLRGKDTRMFQDNRGRQVPSVCHITQGFPTSMAKLLSYDVVILSDIIKEAFTPEQISSMVAFVEEFGGGFVMVGGDTSFGSGGYEQTPIDKIMPIEVANRSDPQWTKGNFQLQVKLPVGALHPIMQVGATPEESQAAWTRSFPGFGGINYVKRAKPGAIVLARTDLSYNSMAMSANPTLNDLVLFAVQQIGRGRAMAFCSDTTAAWGTAFERSWGTNGRNNLYYAKFWNNTIRWLAADRIARKKGQTSLQVSSPQCAPGDAVHLTIPAASASELSLLELSVTEPERPLEFLPVIWNNAQRCWEARCTARAAGDMRFEATYRNVEGSQVKLEAGVSVAPAANESVAIASRPDLATQIARDTGGDLLTAANAASVLGKIARKSVSTTWKRRQPVWNSAWLLLPLLALVMAEWIIRRREPALHPA